MLGRSDRKILYCPKITFEQNYSLAVIIQTKSRPFEISRSGKANTDLFGHMNSSLAETRDRFSRKPHINCEAWWWKCYGLGRLA